MEASAKPKQVNRNFNKVAYTVFVLAGIYFLIRKDFSSSFTFWAMAPILAVHTRHYFITYSGCGYILVTWA
jgi:hypothetical protein